MHRGRARAEHLHPVHADVPLPVRGSRVITAGSVMNGAASSGQHVCTGSRAEVDLVAAQHDLLAGALAHGARPRVGDRLQLLEAAQLVGEPCRRLHLEHVRELRAGVVEPLDAEGEAHAPLRAELVDEQRVLAPRGRSKSSAGPPALTVRSTISVTSRRGSTSARDADELALALEQRDPLAQVGRGRHGV